MDPEEEGLGRGLLPEKCQDPDRTHPLQFFFEEKNSDEVYIPVV